MVKGISACKSIPARGRHPDVQSVIQRIKLSQGNPVAGMPVLYRRAMEDNVRLVHCRKTGASR